MQQNEIHNYSDIQFFRPAEVCKILKISLATFWRICRTGELKTFKLTERTTTVKASDLRAFIESKGA